MKPTASSPCISIPPAVRRLQKRTARTSLRLAIALDNQRRGSLRQHRPDKAKRLVKELRMMISALATRDYSALATIERKLTRREVIGNRA
jgi:hypothetical protein